MKDARIYRIAEISPFQRGDGLVTTLLIGRDSVPGTSFTSGLTQFPPGRAAPMHSHNCAEQVTLLEGKGRLRSTDNSSPEAVRHHLYPGREAAPLQQCRAVADDDPLDLCRGACHPDIHRDRQDGRSSLAWRHGAARLSVSAPTHCAGESRRKIDRERGRVGGGTKGVSGGKRADVRRARRTGARRGGRSEPVHRPYADGGRVAADRRRAGRLVDGGG